MRCSHFTV